MFWIYFGFWGVRIGLMTFFAVCENSMRSTKTRIWHRLVKCVTFSPNKFSKPFAKPNINFWSCQYYSKVFGACLCSACAKVKVSITYLKFDRLFAKSKIDTFWQNWHLNFGKSLHTHQFCMERYFTRPYVNVWKNPWRGRRLVPTHFTFWLKFWAYC